MKLDELWFVKPLKLEYKHELNKLQCRLLLITVSVAAPLWLWSHQYTIVLPMN